MQAVLSFEQAPPLSVPFRFFLTAPVFGALAGAYLVCLGPAALEVRSGFPALALTHAVTVGFLLQIMCGALMQLAPVAAGANVWRPQWTGALLHLGLTVGGVALIGGFVLARPGLFQVAALVLGSSMMSFVATVLFALLRTPAKGPTVDALRLAAGALGITVALGVGLAGVLGWGWPLTVSRLLPVHAAWGLMAWSLVLVAGVSYLVVPMFQLTPAYPITYACWLPRGLVAAVAIWSILSWAGDQYEATRQTAALMTVVLGASYAVTTLHLQHRRRRRAVDSTLLFFRTAMICGLGSAMLALAMPAAASPLRALTETLIGMLLLVGVFISLVEGMLYKIVPFITWLHLQRRVAAAPTMNLIVSERSMRRQLRLHWLSLGALLLSTLLPAVAYIAGLLFAASNALLGWNLCCALRVYRRAVAVESAG